MRVSFYFFAGDFCDVLKRYEEKKEQIYQTHNEVAQLILGLRDAGCEVTTYSLVSQRRTDERPLEGVRIVQLGAPTHEPGGRLRAAVDADESEKIVAHFPTRELLHAVIRKNVRSFAVLANSYNRSGIRAALERRRIRNLVNNDCFEWVSNHCVPATRHLAAMGVSEKKLIPWDVPHPFQPYEFEAKIAPGEQPYKLMYVGSITEDKGVGDLVCAVGELRQSGLHVNCGFAGLGDIDEIKTKGRSVGADGQLEFLGLIGNDEVFKRMRDADLVIVPSRRIYAEGFPLTIFEAIASRTPIVCSDHPMFRAHMIDGQSASVFHSDDPHHLASAIRATLTNDDLYARLSGNAIVTWGSLKGTADWRTMLHRWVLDQDNGWFEKHSLARHSSH